jgi:hypothetical protein
MTTQEQRMTYGRTQLQPPPQDDQQSPEQGKQPSQNNEEDRTPPLMDPVYTMATTQDVIRQEARQSQAQLVGSGILINNGWDRIFWRVDDWEPGVMTLQLVLDTRLWAWKSIVVTTLRNNGNWEWVREIAVNSNDRVASVQLYPSDLAAMFKLDFWKHGFGGLGRWVTAVVLDTPSHMGKSLQFTVDRD